MSGPDNTEWNAWYPLDEESTHFAGLPGGADASISTATPPPRNHGASLSGPVDNPASPSGGSPGAGLGGSQSQAALVQQTRNLTPEQLMKLADEMEADLAAQKETLRNPSAVEPTLERDTGVPFWLRQYMQEQPGGGDPYGQSPPDKQRTREEAVNRNPYLRDSEKDRYRF